MHGRGAAKCKAPPAQFLRPDPPALPEDALQDETHATHTHAQQDVEEVETDGARHASASEPQPPPVRAPWAELTEDEHKQREREQHAREQHPHQPWIELTPDVLRRTVIPECENPHAYAKNQPQHKAPPAEPKFRHNMQTHTLLAAS